MKMDYLKIRADFKYATKGRFYRIFLVKEEEELSSIIIPFLPKCFNVFLILYFVPSS